MQLNEVNLTREFRSHSHLWIKDLVVNFLNKSIYTSTSSELTKLGESEALTPILDKSSCP